jgi:hypothetical protein
MSTPTFFQMVKSVLSAFLGVQSQANRTQDFTGGSASHYIAVGIGVTIVFILMIVLVVKLVLGA